MQKKITDVELKNIAISVKNKLFIPLVRKNISVFLCGADKNDEKTSRSKMAKIFSMYSKYEIIYPEDLFDDLLAGQGHYSLLELENILANGVDAIVLFPESPGSFAELGAFSNNVKLASKMIVLSNNRYKNHKSFINYGPNRLIRLTEPKTGKILHINYADLENPDINKDIFRKVNNQINRIRKINPVDKNIDNILEVENFILPCIYLIDEINNITLYQLLEHASHLDKNICEIATKSSLARLISAGLISRTPVGYKVTRIGVKKVCSEYNTKYLDLIRIEILNSIYRSKARVNYDNII